jgi:hypothetical protein
VYPAPKEAHTILIRELEEKRRCHFGDIGVMGG